MIGFENKPIIFVSLKIKEGLDLAVSFGAGFWREA
jgi:hypothetical protein